MIYVFWILAGLACILPNIEFILSLMLISFLLMVITELKRDKLLIAISLLYWYIMDILFDRTLHQLVIETIIFIVWAIGLKFIPEITSLPYNDKNICIAFYRGKNGSIRARLSALLGLDVTSTDILYRGELWRYRHGKLTKTNTKHILDQFVYFDTGIKPTKKLDRLLSSISDKPYKKSWYKPNCTRILLPFLVELHLQSKGLNLIPSLYLRGLLNGKR